MGLPIIDSLMHIPDTSWAHTTYMVSCTVQAAHRPTLFIWYICSRWAHPCYMTYGTPYQLDHCQWTKATSSWTIYTEWNTLRGVSEVVIVGRIVFCKWICWLIVAILWDHFRIQSCYTSDTTPEVFEPDLLNLTRNVTFWDVDLGGWWGIV